MSSETDSEWNVAFSELLVARVAYEDAPRAVDELAELTQRWLRLDDARSAIHRFDVDVSSGDRSSAESMSPNPPVADQTRRLWQTVAPN